jgi:hypothetical protein
MITKFGIWGAVFGIGATLLVTGLVAAFAKGESSASWNLMWPYFAILWPARTLCQLMGWSWPPGDYVATSQAQALIICTNAVVGAALGIVFGLAVRAARTGN